VLSPYAKITSDHRVDCTQSVHLGHYSHLAGAGSQVWTHAYVHDETGPGRYRIDGPVIIESNVYVGSACVISLGVRIGQGIIVGAGSTVSKTILDPGMYVSSPLRHLPRPQTPDLRDELRKACSPALQESVFVKPRP
jgi:acetyltransferase-like isoleucine patch superfamily enzyme